MAGTQASTAGNGVIPWSRVVPEQICAYAALFAASMISPMRDASGAVSVTFAVVPVAVIMVVFIWHSPLRDGMAGRLIAGIGGVLSLACAVVRTLGHVFFPAVATGAEGSSSAVLYPQETWAAGVAGLLVLLVLVSFGRQMAREDRSHLIRSLSHGVTDGVAMIAAPGWCFLPDLIVACRGGVSGNAAVAAWAGCAVIVVLAVLLGAASCKWACDVNPTPRVARPWLGVGLMPVLFMGPVVAVASLVVELV